MLNQFNLVEGAKFSRRNWQLRVVDTAVFNNTAGTVDVFSFPAVQEEGVRRMRTRTRHDVRTGRCVARSSNFNTGTDNNNIVTFHGAGYSPPVDMNTLVVGDELRLSTGVFATCTATSVDPTAYTAPYSVHMDSDGPFFFDQDGMGKFLSITQIKKPAPPPYKETQAAEESQLSTFAPVVPVPSGVFRVANGTALLYNTGELFFTDKPIHSTDSGDWTRVNLPM